MVKSIQKFKKFRPIGSLKESKDCSVSPELSCVRRFISNQNPDISDFEISLQFNRLQTTTMEVTTQRMHGPLRGELGKFGKF